MASKLNASVANRYSVVVAWVEEQMVHDGKPFAVDLGKLPRLVPSDVAKSVMWKNNATEVDLTKATAFAEREHGGGLGRVYVYDASEKDPLGKARKDVLAKKPSANCVSKRS